MIQKKKTVTPKKPFGTPKTEEKKKIVKVEEEDEEDDDDDLEDMDGDDFDESGSDLDDIDEDVDDDDDDDDDEGDDDDDEEDDDEEGDDSDESDSEETPAKGKTPQTQQKNTPANKKLNASAKKLAAENEGKDVDDTQVKKTPAKRKIDDAVDNNSVQKKTKHENNLSVGDIAERDKKSLFVKNLPVDCSEESIKSLSKDILAVHLPTRKNTTGNQKYRFGYLQFENEAIVEKNYKLLQNKSLGGRKLVIDYVGPKSQFSKVVDNKKLFIKSIGTTVNMKELAKYFENAVELFIHRRADKSCFAYAIFASPNDAADALAKCGKWTFAGEKVEVNYGNPTDVTAKNKGKKRRSKK